MYTSHPNRDEEGFGFLIVVVIIASVMAILAATVFRAAIDNVSTSARGVETGQALQAAEAGVDAAYQKIAGSHTLAAMPCGPITGTLDSAPAVSTYTVAIKYYSTLTTRTTIACTPGGGSNPALKNVKGVELTSKGQDVAQTGIVQSEAHLSPSLTPEVFDEAIFITGSLTVQGSNALDVGNRNLYVKGNLHCLGTGTIKGSVVVVPNPTVSGTGKATLNGTCTITGQLEATGNIALSGSAKVNGTIISTTGSISITSTTVSVNGNMYAHGTITYPTTWFNTKYNITHTVTLTGVKTKIRYTVNKGYTWLTPPASQPFPTINWTPTTVTHPTPKGWIGKGYKTVTAGSTCAKAYSVIFSVHTATTTTGTAKPKAVYTTCKISLAPTKKYCPTWSTKSKCRSVPMVRSLAIFTTGGITMSTSKASFTSTNGKLTLFLIVPTHVYTKKTPTKTKVTCTATNPITIHGTIGSTLNTLLYSPCTIGIKGASVMASGEIATKSFTANGGTTIGQATATVPKAKGGGLTGGNPTIGVIYEREYK